MTKHPSWRKIESYDCPVCNAELWGYYEWETQRWLVVHGTPNLDERPGEAHIVVDDWQNHISLTQEEQREMTEAWCREVHAYTEGG